MLDYNTLELQYPKFPMLQPDMGICRYMQQVIKQKVYSSYIEQYCIGMLKFILNENNQKYKAELKILMEIYDILNKKEIKN